MCSVFAGDKTPAGFPQISVLRPNTRVIEISHTAVLQCKASGNPTPKIYWLKDSKRVDMANPRYSIIDGTCVLVVLHLFCPLSSVLSPYILSPIPSAISVRHI